MCSQRAGAEIGAGPDLYTACQVLTSIRTLLANLQNLYGQALLAKYQNHTGMHCLPSSESLASSTLTAGTVNRFQVY
jgi:hypothetical protein